MMYPLVAELAADQVPVAVACRVLRCGSSGYYQWRGQPACGRDLQDAYLCNAIRDVHTASRGTYGAPRVHAELRLGLGIRCGRKRVERLMRWCGLAGVTRRARRGCTRRDPAAGPSDDLVNRKFAVTGPDRLWCADITEHPTGQGKVYAAVVIDAWSRRVVGLSIADHLRAELVTDALQMAIWRRGGRAAGTIHHSDHGTQGEFNWSSQRCLSSEERQCSKEIDSGSRRLAGGGCVRLGGRRWRGGRSGSSSGRG